MLLVCCFLLAAYMLIFFLDPLQIMDRLAEFEIKHRQGATVKRDAAVYAGLSGAKLPFTVSKQTQDTAVWCAVSGCKWGD
jgi:hypothetical protein